jgi:hypothetical protein
MDLTADERDLVTRLRHSTANGKLCDEAAAEIERLGHQREQQRAYWRAAAEKALRGDLEPLRQRMERNKDTP